MNRGTAAEQRETMGRPSFKASQGRPSRIGLFARRQKRLIRGLVVLGVLGGAGFGFVALHGTDTLLPALRDRLQGAMPLRVTSIRVEGQNLTSLESIQDALQIHTGDPVLNFNVAAARTRLDALPFVDHASVERHFSGAIVVRLVERPPFAVWQNKGKFMLIDRAGNVVPDQGMTGKDAQAFLQLPLVVGDNAAAGAASLLDALAAEPEVRSRMTAAVLVGQRRWTLTLHDGTTVLLPEGEEVPALHRLSQLQAQFGLLDRPVAAIDLRLPDRLTIRQRQSDMPADPAADGSTAPAAAAPGVATTPDAGTGEAADAKPGQPAANVTKAAAVPAGSSPAATGTKMTPHSNTQPGSRSGAVHGAANPSPGEGNTSRELPT